MGFKWSFIWKFYGRQERGGKQLFINCLFFHTYTQTKLTDVNNKYATVREDRDSANKKFDGTVTSLFRENENLAVQLRNTKRVAADSSRELMNISKEVNVIGVTF